MILFVLQCQLGLSYLSAPRPRARERDKRFGKETWRRDHLDVAAELLDLTDRICVPAAAITWSES